MEITLDINTQFKVNGLSDLPRLGQVMKQLEHPNIEDKVNVSKYIKRTIFEKCHLEILKRTVLSSKR